MTLAGKTAVVTGGSRGIGRAIVRRLAADGARVVFSYRQDKIAADALAREFGNALAVRADQEDPASIEVLFEPVADGLDILVNNAAVNPHALIRDITPELFDRAMTVNARGASPSTSSRPGRPTPTSCAPPTPPRHWSGPPRSLP